MTNIERGDEERNIYVASMKQKIPQISGWCQFLRNNQNNAELLITGRKGYFKTHKVS